MVLNEGLIKLIIWCLMFISIQSSGLTGVTQDQTSSRPNTLSDDADDIQRQLDNEARDRLNFGRPKTIWVVNFPTTFPIITSTYGRLRRQSESNVSTCVAIIPFVPPPARVLIYYFRESCSGDMKEILIQYLTLGIIVVNQHQWSEKYAECASRSQSPVDLPNEGLVKVTGGRKLMFANYDALPVSLTLQNDGRRLIFYGEWAKKRQPLVYGGPAYSRRYLFHCLILHWPSEHTVGGLQYPLETQALHISADYSSFQEAIEASSSDPQAFLGVVNIYKFSKTTHGGLNVLLRTAMSMGMRNGTVASSPVSYFSPPFRSCACYQGSLTFPPCTESVLWLVRGKALPVTREAVEAAHSLIGDDNSGQPKKILVRQRQPLNDRKIFWFT